MTAAAPSTHRPLLGVIGFAVLFLTTSFMACSDSNVSQADRVVDAPAIAAPSGIGPDGARLTLEVVDGGETTGAIITDHRGYAVYGLTGEGMDGPPRCSGACLDAWIPLAPRDGGVSERLDAELYEVYVRPDGIEQATYAGVPLYLWSGDSQVGITGGAGVAGTWFALTAVAGYVS